MSVDLAHAPGSLRRRERSAEATEVHTGLIRLALGVEESRAYWEHVDFTVTIADRAKVAFEQRWFGSKSLVRVRFLLSNFMDRYDRYPGALVVLRRWRSMDAATRQALCHWHLQLSDPLYRRFTGEFLAERRSTAGAKIDRDVILRWLRREFPNRWSESTCVQIASKLRASASAAGLVAPTRNAGALLFPNVPDAALTYMLYLLRETRFAGTLVDNVYLASLGLAGAVLDQRLRSVPGLTFRRMANLTEFEWDAPDLEQWAIGAL